MDALSPTRTCDPWAVQRKQLETGPAGKQPAPEEIRKLCGETGGMEPGVGPAPGNNPLNWIGRTAALRHMEKVRGELREGEIYRLVVTIE
jgi:hypothetical protein